MCRSHQSPRPRTRLRDSAPRRAPGGPSRSRRGTTDNTWRRTKTPSDTRKPRGRSAGTRARPRAATGRSAGLATPRNRSDTRRGPPRRWKLGPPWKKTLKREVQWPSPVWATPRRRLLSRLCRRSPALKAADVTEIATVTSEDEAQALMRSHRWGPCQRWRLGQRRPGWCQPHGRCWQKVRLLQHPRWWPRRRAAAPLAREAP
mmetsp:Transcript_34819/g.96093  ORF Transcript_34819/g.96093 Transcript_34819/m.96093 type:complete len:203 (+) Transcript_34819:542-1150(+)